MNSQLAFIDTETTGLDPDWNPIWEVAVIVDDVEYVWQQRLPLNLESAILGRKDYAHLIIAEEAPPPSGLEWISAWCIDDLRARYDRDNALPPYDSIRQFVKLVEEDRRHLVGAVPSFDEERLRKLYRQEIESTETQFPWHYHLIDVEALAVGYLSCGAKEYHDVEAPGLPWHSDDLSRALRIDPPSDADRHTALADARWAKAIYEAVVS